MEQLSDIYFLSTQNETKLGLHERRISSSLCEYHQGLLECLSQAPCKCTLKSKVVDEKQDKIAISIPCTHHRAILIISPLDLQDPAAFKASNFPFVSQTASDAHEKILKDEWIFRDDWVGIIRNSIEGVQQ